MSNKTRLDVLLTEQGLQESRQKAQATIMSGLVFVNGQRVDKPGTAVPNDAKIEIRGNTLKYVSRGGLKLEKAMAEFPIELNGCICGDIGASTGGFTDCMLQNGASKVYSVDVGYGQLAWKLREDPRVVCMERTNARYLTHEQIPDELDFASIDVSFISLKLILPAVANVLKDGGYVASLVKPQFEAGREKVGKKGVVRDPAVHKEVLEHYLEHAREAGFGVLGLTYSPIRGPEGNIEYLGFLQKGAETTAAFDLDALVEESHQTLKEHGEGRYNGTEENHSLSESGPGHRNEGHKVRHCHFAGHGLSDGRLFALPGSEDQRLRRSALQATATGIEGRGYGHYSGRRRDDPASG